MQAINQQSRRERLAAYRRNPFSLFLAALVTLSAVITLAVLISLIIYILYRLFFNKLYLFLLFALVYPLAVHTLLKAEESLEHPHLYS